MRNPFSVYLDTTIPDMNPFGHLSDENDEQLRKYLKFFRHKKEGILRSITREFQDISNDKLTEEMYTKDDVMEYTDFLSSAIVVTDIIMLFIKKLLNLLL
jgi:hypothetical protein